ncbi:MAG TPA: alpha/beta hydrolase [Candidatus Limnocylindrales bacterium]|nr:alpha/beta hydrolase [Candidatus Limnocylindrales bacterium]
MNVRAGKLDVRYELTGDAGLPVVTFVHGLAASLEIWSGQEERLSDRFRVLRYDLRAHGGTTAPAGPCSRHDLAADLVALLDALAIDRTAVVGHSAGGVVAQQTAVDFPSRVSALGLVGTASECNDKTAAWYSRCMEIAVAEGGAAVMKLMGMKPDRGPVPDGPGMAPVIAAMRTLNENPLTAALRSVSVPTMIVVGEKDFLGVGGSVILSRTIAGSEIEIVAGRGHGIYLEDPDWFANKLGDFLKRHAGLPPA